MQYYAAPDEIDIIRGAEILTFFDSAVIAFNAKKYSVALTYLNLSSADIDLKYYFKAIISFELKQYSKANEYFRILLRKKHETLNIQDIEWYYFLNNLACGANCKSVFESSLKIIILNTNHKYFSEVSEIIQDSKYIK